ncbi:MAG: hypothetical protein AB7V14_03145 [Kiritimatiellia bacterium]
MEALSHLRHLIAALDEAVVDSLCVRAQRRLNESLYVLPDAPVPALQALAGQFAESPTLAGRIHILRTPYLRQWLPALCDPGHDKGQPACLSADGACLEAIAHRLALSVHVATRKREALPPALQSAVLAGDPARIERAITHPEVEEDVRARVKALAAARAPHSEIPARVAAVYADGIIPLSRKIQVCGLLAHP